jgi:hypothetical protein
MSLRIKDKNKLKEHTDHLIDTFRLSRGFLSIGREYMCENTVKVNN